MFNTPLRVLLNLLSYEIAPETATKDGTKIICTVCTVHSISIQIHIHKPQYELLAHTLTGLYFPANHMDRIHSLQYFTRQYMLPSTRQRIQDNKYKTALFRSSMPFPLLRMAHTVVSVGFTL